MTGPNSRGIRRVGRDVEVSSPDDNVAVTHMNTDIRRLYRCVNLPFDDPVEAVERTFEAAETQFVVRAGR